MGDLNLAPDVLELRWQAYEDNRKKKIKTVMKERKKLIEQGALKKNR